MIVEKNNYVTNIKYIKSKIVTEYDMSKANISVLREKGRISEKEYIYLYNLPKQSREVYIGKMISRDYSVHDIIESGIIEAKIELVKSNNIPESHIIRVANDAVYILSNKTLKNTAFGNYIKFKTGHRYTSFAKLGRLLVLFNSHNDEMNINIIGLGKDNLELHRDYMISFIANMLYMSENNTLEQCMEFFMQYYNNYLSRNLPVGFYREFNPDSVYRIPRSEFGCETVYNTNGIDIHYNAAILRELYSLIVGSFGL